MKAKKLFWKIHFAGQGWSEKNFDFYFELDQLGGILYAGFTLFGWSILYSDHW